MFRSIQNTLGTHGRGSFTVVDRRFSGLHGCPGAANPQKTWENHPKMGLTRDNQRQITRESSAHSYAGDQNRDRKLREFLQI